MHIQTLAEKTSKLLKKIEDKPFLNSFYLSGGTALALHLGHRESEDLDFFTQTDFDPSVLQQQLELVTDLSGVEQDIGTLNCYADQVQLQFLHYPYNLLSKPIIWNSIMVSSVEDIACTKLLTIGRRGSKKDFIDMYFILQRYSLAELFDLLTKKYPKTDYNQIHILKSLAFFDDAESQPMPRMHVKISWEDIKKDIVTTLKNYPIA